MDKRKVPVMFQRLNDVTNAMTDTRFIEVKIWLMHLGENYNGSYFSKEAVEKAIPTLANTPILGFIEKDILGDDDFSDHRSIIIKENGKYKSRYIGNAYGLIPESNDAKFEFRVGDDGIEREYLTVKGLVWRKNDEAVDIFNRDSIKSQSMELHEDFEGVERPDGLFEFTNFKFFGACALGEGVPPAMNSATIETQFSSGDLHKYIQSKMNEFKLMQENGKENCDSGKNENEDIKNNHEGGNKMDKEKLIAEFRKFLEEGNSFYVESDDTHVFAMTADKKLVGYEFTVDAEKEEVSINAESVKHVEVSFAVSEEEKEFNFTLNDIVAKEIEAKEVEVTEALTTQFTADKEKAVGEIQVQLSKAQTDFASLQGEVEDLKSKLGEYATKERKEAEEAVFEEFATVFTEEDAEFVEIKGKASEFADVESLKTALFTLAGKKALEGSFTKKEEKEGKDKKGNTKVGVDFNKKVDPTVNPLLIKYFGENK